MLSLKLQKGLLPDLKIWSYNTELRLEMLQRRLHFLMVIVTIEDIFVLYIT